MHAMKSTRDHGKLASLQERLKRGPLVIKCAFSILFRKLAVLADTVPRPIKLTALEWYDLAI